MGTIDTNGALHDNLGRYADQNKPDAGFEGYTQQGRTGAEPGGEHIKAYRDELAKRLTADPHTPDK